MLLKKALPWLKGRTDRDGRKALLIRGDKVVIRDKHLEDAKNDYSWRTDIELSRLDATQPIKMSYEAFLKYSRSELDYPSPNSKRLAIDTFEGFHIGNCMFYDIDSKPGQAELGIMIGDRKYQGKGYGTDAVNALLGHIFETTSLERVYLHTLEWNSRARSSFAKSGFREVEKVRRGGLDFMLMDVHRERWIKGRPLDVNCTSCEIDG